MEKLGIEPVMLLTQIINFGIIVFVLSKFLYKPLLKTIEERKKKIAEGLKLAQEMSVKEEDLKKEREKIIEKARAEAQKIVNEAKNDAKAIEEKLLAEANEEVKALKERSRKDLEKERERVLEEAHKQILTIASAIAQRAVGDSLADKKNQIAIIEKKIAIMEREKLNA